MKDTYYVELRDECDRSGPPRIAPVEALSSGEPLMASNFRSTYMFGSELATSIQANGHTRGLKGKPIASNVLYIDVDEDDNIEKVEQILVSNNIYANIYDTGNRGRHYHIPIKFMEGVNVIYSQIKWLKSLQLWDLVDQSIYREGSQYRRTGAVHHKTGEVKKFLDSNLTTGPLINIPILVAPPQVSEPFSEELGDSTNMQIFLMNCMQKRSEGGRHSHMFILWRSGKKAGLDKDSLKDMIHWWNHRQDTPHPDRIVEDKLERFK